ncbi:Fpg/Nei family DNA glycosylase [Paenibacillus spiritus]|uniref:Formamidopyrimidine-DNA glycosylase n=1 Tax=Paenibacillus spiritus TaxID=2496557 RepID=A0A5J5GFN4_9BACL|nr:DNA-formamidopyrimidine glycosylase family protein [Paenibacillus spiritus]KAA9006513.1 Fpg/Nei family DNA glycosylase [Paenibacillus spiritus]
MPELPEMENYRRLLSQHILNKPITEVIVNREKSLNVEADVLRQTLPGARIIFVERRGKHLLFHLSDGRRLLLHLMLGGLLFYGTEDQRPLRSTQIEIVFGENRLYMMGLRLGYLHLLSVKETEAALSKLGPELLDRRMSAERFKERVRGRRGALKTMFVNQTVFAGIGNCYSDEIAFQAGLRPDSPVQGLGDDALGRLYEAAGTVLRNATDIGGYMEMPFMEGDTVTGRYNDRCLVYDRGGEACYRCGGTILKEELSGRKVFYCPDCQHDR